MSGNTWNQPNEQHPELLSTISLNSFPGHVSSSRQAMLASQLGQFLVHDGTNQRVIQTGTEKEFGKATFSIKIPVDAEIIDIINRYEPGIGHDSINHNPETLIIYEDVETKQVGCLSIEQYCSKHQYFGFRYKATPALSQLRVGAFIKKDTILFDSPNIDSDGAYNFGIQANVCLMTHPATSEDGFLVSRQWLDKQKFRIYETRVVEWGSKNYALYIHGTEENPKTYPDIGEYIPSHGILMATRSYDPDNLAPVETSKIDIREIDHTFDEAVYVNGPGGKIIDIRVHHDLINTNTAEVHTNKQTQKYDKARRSYYQRIFNTYNRLHKKRGAALQLTPEFHRLVFETLGVVQESPNQKITKVFRQEPIDEYRVEFVIEYEITGDIGFKSTCLFGGTV